MKAYRKIIKRKNLYRQFLELANPLLGLTNRELEVLTILLQIQMEQKPMFGHKYDILNAQNRKFVMNETRVNKVNLSKYISRMKKLGIVLKDQDGHYINNMFIPELKDNKVEILYLLEIEKENEINK